MVVWFRADNVHLGLIGFSCFRTPERNTPHICLGNATGPCGLSS